MPTSEGESSAVHELPPQRLPQIGMKVDGTIKRILDRVGVLVDIGASCDALLPNENFIGKIRRPRVGYRLSFLEVIDVDRDAEDPQKRIILGGEDFVNMTPSPLLLSPVPSLFTSPAPSRVLSPVTSHRPSPHSSPEISAQGDPPLGELEPLSLDGGAEPREAKGQLPHRPIARPMDPPQWATLSSPEASSASRAGERSAPRREAPQSPPQHAEAPQAAAGDRAQSAKEPAGRVPPVRRALLARARQLGLASHQLAPVMRSLDLLELQIAVLDRARELGVAHARLAPVLQSIDALSEAVPKPAEPARASIPKSRARQKAPGRRMRGTAAHAA